MYKLKEPRLGDSVSGSLCVLDEACLLTNGQDNQNFKI
jgi:hypothetical protein